MFRKELAYYFSTPIAYIVIGLYQLAISLFLWVIPGQWNIIDSGYAQVDGLFQLSPWLFMLLCPALTMPCFVHYFVVAYMAEPMGNLDSGAFLGSFIGLILLSGTFMAVGLLCATFSKSQIVCFIGGALVCFILYWVLLQDHYSALSRGVLDLRDVLWFVTVSVLAIIASILTIDRLTKK